MSRELNRLTARKVANEKRPGYHADGAGLYLQVTATGARSWIFRYMLNGKAREMGLGSASLLSLGEARVKRDEQRRLLLQKVDPIIARDSADAARVVEASKAVTFGECSGSYIKAHRAAWRNEKHAEQWASTLNTYAAPVFGHLPVQTVDTGLVLKALEPIWSKKPETATRVRGRIESVLDWATARGYRAGENPARWRGHLDKLLPAVSKRKRVKHHAALPFDELGAFVADLRKQDGLAAVALEFCILTAARTGEAIRAKWGEFDLDAGVWTVPADRMKAHREHRVPLSGRAVELLRALANAAGDTKAGDYVFPGRRAGDPLSNMAMLALLKRMSRPDLTVHGFRSSFRDWASERTNFPREVCEMALAHVVSNQVEAAYRRGDLFEKRRQLMAAWAKHCNTVKPATGTVVSLAGRAA